MTHHVLFFFSRSRLAVVVMCLLAGVGGCIEGQSTIRVASLKLNGVRAVKASQLTSVLATAQSSKLPWGAKHYFTRQQFEADLKRIAAFYKDRGYPDAKVRSFDVKLNAKQDAVDITINIDEGQPVVVEAIEYNGFDILPAAHFTPLKTHLPPKEKAPLDRALAQASREAALDEVKDHGFPYATVRLTDRPGSNDHARVLTLSVVPGTLSHYVGIPITDNTTSAPHAT